MVRFPEKISKNKKRRPFMEKRRGVETTFLLTETKSRGEESRLWRKGGVGGGSWVKGALCKIWPLQVWLFEYTGTL